MWLLRRAGAPARWVVVLGFLTFGVATGLLAAWVWPYDSCVLPNLWAVVLGDALYELSSEYLGDPAGLPAVLRVPWVYPLAGAILYGALGLCGTGACQLAAGLAGRAVSGERRTKHAGLNSPLIRSDAGLLGFG